MFSHITKDFFGNKYSRSIGVCFSAFGLLIGSWATFIPNVKANFNLNDAELGLLLLCIPFGALTMNPIAASLVRTKGMLKTTLIGLAGLLLFFGMLFNIAVIPLLTVILFLCGSSISVGNVAINTCVNSIEQQFGVKIMSTCHGMFSLGLMFGSLSSSFFNSLQVLPQHFMIGLCVFMFLALIIPLKTLFNLKEEESLEEESGNAKFIIPKGSFLLMIIISLCINITEGTMTDWTAVYMREVVKTSTFFEGWGLASYSFFMAFGRFIGDKIIPKFGSNKVLFWGGILAISGILLSILLPFTATAIIGFALVGAGVSCGAPILYASAARVPNMAKGSGLALMNTFAMGGFLFGPVIIGFISKALSLPIAFAFIATLGLVWLFQSKRVTLF